MQESLRVRKAPQHGSSPPRALARFSESKIRQSPNLAPPIVHDVLRSPGEPLDGATRGIMEQKFGYDFSNVRVHSDERATESSRAVNAKAYTVGSDVVFDRHEFNPRSRDGQSLLAHELAHVVQQRDAHASGPLRIGEASNAWETNARRAAKNFEHGSHALPGAASADAHIQRTPRDGDDPQHHGRRAAAGQQTRVITVAVPPPAAQTVSAPEAHSLAQQTPAAPTPAASSAPATPAATPATTTPATTPAATPATTPATAIPAATPATTPATTTPVAPTPAAATPAAARSIFGPLHREPVQFGLDFTYDSTQTLGAGLLPRHLDAFRFTFLGAPVDLGHEPTLTGSVSLDPATSGVASVGLAGTLLNVHLQQHGEDWIELALGQAGCAYDTNRALTCSVGAGAEFHTSDPHLSFGLGAAATITRAPDGGVTTAFGGLTFSVIIHAVNP